jgi:hypothetical protein
MTIFDALPPEALWTPQTGAERSRVAAQVARDLIAQIDATGQREAYAMGRSRDRAGWVEFAEIHERNARGEW